MFVGLSKRVNKRIHVDDAIAYYPKDEYICPVCKAPLIIKNGQINVPHFAHKSLQDCDTFTQDMSKWHRDWQNVFPKKIKKLYLLLKQMNTNLSTIRIIMVLVTKIFINFILF